MTRGFVTIATGEERYYDIARNLLWSYQQFASKKYPFAIICDKENKYTKEFDDIIILEKAYCNYLDKLQLYKYLPYDETIFIDADSLAYGDLDEWWNIFAKATDFSLFGYAWMDLESGRGWFVPDGMREYKDKITYIPDFNGGIYYMRKSETCKNVFELANYFANNFAKYAFNGFDQPADEPCLALAMAVNNCMPLDIQEKGLIFAPKRKNIDLDILLPKAIYHNETKSYNVNLIHWSNYRTQLSLYKYEVRKLKLIREKNNCGVFRKLFYESKLVYYILCIGNINAYIKRLKNKLKRL